MMMTTTTTTKDADDVGAITIDRLPQLSSGVQDGAESKARYNRAPRDFTRNNWDAHTHTHTLTLKRRGKNKRKTNSMGKRDGAGEWGGTTTEQDTPRGRQGTATATMMKTSSCKKHQRSSEKIWGGPHRKTEFSSKCLLHFHLWNMLLTLRINFRKVHKFN